MKKERDTWQWQLRCICPSRTTLQQVKMGAHVSLPWIMVGGLDICLCLPQHYPLYNNHCSPHPSTFVADVSLKDKMEVCFTIPFVLKAFHIHSFSKLPLAKSFMEETGEARLYIQVKEINIIYWKWCPFIGGGTISIKLFFLLHLAVPHGRLLTERRQWICFNSLRYLAHNVQ